MHARGPQNCSVESARWTTKLFLICDQIKVTIGHHVGFKLKLSNVVVCWRGIA